MPKRRPIQRTDTFQSDHEFVIYHSRIAFEATSTSGANRYSSMRRAPVLSSTVTAIPEVSGWSGHRDRDRLDVGLQHHWEHEILPLRSPPAKPAALEARVGSPSIALASGSGMASLAMRVTCA